METSVSFFLISKPGGVAAKLEVEASGSLKNPLDGKVGIVKFDEHPHTLRELVGKWKTQK